MKHVHHTHMLLMLYDRDDHLSAEDKQNEF